MSEHRNTTRCRCGNVWVPRAWHGGYHRNVQCPRCRGWNQVGVTDLRYRPPGTRAVEAAIARALGRVGL